MSAPDDDSDDIAASGLTPDEHARMVARIRDLPEIEPAPGYVERATERARDAGLFARPLTIVAHRYVPVAHTGITILAAQPEIDLVRFVLSGPFGARYGAVRAVRGTHGPCAHFVPVEERPGDAPRGSWVGGDELTALVDRLASPVTDQARVVEGAIYATCDEARLARR